MACAAFACKPRRHAGHESPRRPSGPHASRRGRSDPRDCARSRSSPAVAEEPGQRYGAAQGRSFTRQERKCGCVSEKCSRFAIRCFCSAAGSRPTSEAYSSLADEAARDVGRDARADGRRYGRIEGFDDERALIIRQDFDTRCVSRMSPSNLLLTSMTSGTRPGDAAEEILEATGSCRALARRRSDPGQVRELALAHEAASRPVSRSRSKSWNTMASPSAVSAARRTRSGSRARWRLRRRRSCSR